MTPGPPDRIISSFADLPPAVETLNESLRFLSNLGVAAANRQLADKCASA
jgi:uncharacterized protein YoxC